MKDDDVIYFFKTEKIHGSSNHPAGERSRIAIDQSKSAFAGSRLGRVEITINRDKDDWKTGMAKAVAVVALFESKKLDFVENPNDRYAENYGHLYDAEDQRSISAAMSIFDFSANDELGRQAQIQQDYDEAVSNGKDDKQRMMDIPANSDDDPNRLFLDRPRDYTHGDNVKNSKHGSWIYDDSSISKLKRNEN